VAARLQGIVGLNPAGGMDICIMLIFFFKFCQVEIFTASRSLVQRIPTECGLSECDF
jgi:hypothetical protein